MPEQKNDDMLSVMKEFHLGKDWTECTPNSIHGEFGNSKKQKLINVHNLFFIYIFFIFYYLSLKHCLITDQNDRFSSNVPD